MCNFKPGNSEREMENQKQDKTMKIIKEDKVINR